jgi:hypothetical protein
MIVSPPLFVGGSVGFCQRTHSALYGALWITGFRRDDFGPGRSRVLGSTTHPSPGEPGDGNTRKTPFGFNVLTRRGVKPVSFPGDGLDPSFQAAPVFSRMTFAGPQPLPAHAEKSTSRSSPSSLQLSGRRRLFLIVGHAPALQKPGKSTETCLDVVFASTGRRGCKRRPNAIAGSSTI